MIKDLRTKPTTENELIELGKVSPYPPNYYTHFRLNQFHKMYVLNRIAYL